VRPSSQRGVIPIPPLHEKPRRSQFWGKEGHFRKRFSSSFRRFVSLSPPLLVLAEERKAGLWFLFCHFSGELVCSLFFHFIRYVFSVDYSHNPVVYLLSGSILFKENGLTDFLRDLTASIVKKFNRWKYTMGISDF
jgi:hypothetical protein